MSPFAEALNETIKKASPTLYDCMSLSGKRMFYPVKGIIAQAAEAGEHADPRLNAAIGMATDEDGPLVFDSISSFFQNLNKEEIFSYSPSMGNPKLRELWKEKLIENNPLLSTKNFSTPVVTSGLTHAVDTVAQFTINEDDPVILPDQIWGNYRLMLQAKRLANLQYYPFLKNDGFNVEGLRESIENNKHKGKVVVLFNFPNNPTGYSPTISEARSICDVLLDFAKKGLKVIALLDEAYYGLFFDNNIYKHSLFSILADAHENIVAFKVCGATKEMFVWGFRIGFISFATKGATNELLDAVEKKLGGIIRSCISNCSTSAQNILIKVMESGSYKKDFAEKYKILEERINEVKRVAYQQKYSDVFTPYPFNSGYFMLLKINDKLPAETLRKSLLLESKMGTIVTAKQDLRIAFSCLEKGRIEDFFQTIYETGKKLLS